MYKLIYHKKALKDKNKLRGDDLVGKVQKLCIKLSDDPGLSIQLCKFIHKPLNIILNSIVKFYQKMRHSFIPISNRHSPFCRNIVDCQV